ncbi:MAG: GAF domain-containing protein [Anaerolineae bacterium]|nr:GAF domain-containing protein [Anaerolineae bacterium]
MNDLLSAEKGIMTTDQGVDGKRAILTGRVYRICVGVLIPFIGFNVLYLWRLGFGLACLLSLISLIMLIAGNGKKMRHAMRSWTLTLVVFCTGIIDLIYYGWISDARLLILVSIFSAALLIGKAVAYGLWGGGVVATTVFLTFTYGSWRNPADGFFESLSLRIVREWFVFVIFGISLVIVLSHWWEKIKAAVQKNTLDAASLADEQNLIKQQEKTLLDHREELAYQRLILDGSAAVTRVMTALQPVDTLLSRSCELVARQFGLDHTAIYMVEGSEPWLVLKAASSEAGRILLSQDFRLRGDKTSIVGSAFVDREYVTIDFNQKESEQERSSLVTSLDSELAIPFAIAGEIVGVFDFQHSEPATFSGVVVGALQDVVAHLAFALSVARRYDEIPVMDMTRPFYEAGYQLCAAREDRIVYEAVVTILNNYMPDRFSFIRKDNQGTDNLFADLDVIEGQAVYQRRPLTVMEPSIIKEISEFGLSCVTPQWVEYAGQDQIQLPNQLYKALVDHNEVCSFAVIPAATESHLTGIYIGLYDTPHFFNEFEKKLFTLIAHLTAFTIERNALLKAALDHDEFDEILGDIRRRIWSDLDPDAILYTTVREIGQLVDAEMTAIDCPGLVSRRHYGSYTYVDKQVSQSDAVLLSHENADLSISLSSENTEFGEIRIKFTEKPELTANKIKLLNVIATESGQALESARLYKEAQDSLNEVGMLYRALQSVISATTQAEVLQAFVENLALPGIDRCIFLIKQDQAADRDGAYARIEAAWDAGQESSPALGQIWQIADIPVLNSEAMVIHDLELDANVDADSRRHLLELGYKALVIVPLGENQDNFGWLVISTLRSRFRFTQRQVLLFKSFADQLTQALASIRLVEAVENRALLERRAREVTERMREPIELQQVIDVAAEEMRQVLDLEDVVIHLTLSGPGDLTSPANAER